MTKYSNPRKEGPQTSQTLFNKRLDYFYNMYSKIYNGTFDNMSKDNLPESFLKEVESCLSIDYKTFESTIRGIYKNDKDSDTLYNMGIAVTYSSAYAMNEITLTLLEKVMSDTDSHWIEYFVYDLDFGSKWRAGMITYHGNDIPLGTIRDLWNLLIWEIALSIKLKSEVKEEI